MSAVLIHMRRQGSHIDKICQTMMTDEIDRLLKEPCWDTSRSVYNNISQKAH